MAIIVECDGGCGDTTDDVSNFSEFGIIKKVWYCAKCAGALEVLYMERDAAHTRHATALEAELMDRLSAFVAANPEARLPDAP